MICLAIFGAMKHIFKTILETLIGIVFIVFIAYGVYSHFNPAPPDPNLHQDYYQFNPDEKPSKTDLLSVFDDLTKGFPKPLQEFNIEKSRYSGNIHLSRTYQDTQGVMAERLKTAIDEQGDWVKVADGDCYCRQQIQLMWKKDTYQAGAFDEKEPALWISVSWDKNGECRKWYYHQKRYQNK